jgi:hypothetical protein
MATLASYTKSESDGVCRFVVTPATAPLPIAMLVFLFIICFLSVFLIPVWFLILWLAKRKARKNRSLSTIIVSRDFIESDNVRLLRADIHRLILRNPISDNEVAYSTAMVGPSATVVLAMGIQAQGQHDAQKLAAVSWRLDADAGGKANRLADGLDQTTAFGLMKDIGRLIGVE